MVDEDNLVQSDPICNSAECSQYLHPKKKDAYPVNYPVPDFGVDRDIQVTQANAAAVPDFDPTMISPEAYDSQDFSLKPLWDNLPSDYTVKDSVKKAALKNYLRIVD